MRIAQVAPLYESVPPRLYGGTELVVSQLSEELVNQGHEVTLFASGDSLTKAKLIPICKRALRLDPNCSDSLAYHILMLERVLREHEDNPFDIIHFHVDYLHFSLSRRQSVPSLTTLHGRLDIPDLVPLYREFREAAVVSVSDSQRTPLPWLNWQATIHHGLAPTSFRLFPQPGKYLAFLGRISPEKGLDQAIHIAKKAGMPLKIAAKIDQVDRAYYEARIKPLIEGRTIEYLGEIGHAEKGEFLGNAAALLTPICWPEPFGLVMIEAMACGTPIIAYARGSVPEIVRPGINGFIVQNPDGRGRRRADRWVLSSARSAATISKTTSPRRECAAIILLSTNACRTNRPPCCPPTEPEVDEGGIKQPYYIATGSSPADDRTRVLKYGEMFAIFNRCGDIETTGLEEQGIFYEGTRILSRLELYLGDAKPLLLSSTVKQDNSLFTADLSNVDLSRDGTVVIPRDTLHLKRRQFLWKGVCYQQFDLFNYGMNPVEISLELAFAADFADIFEVRGVHRAKKGRLLPPMLDSNGIVLGYEGLDGKLRQTRLECKPQPTETTVSGFSFHLHLLPRVQHAITLIIACRDHTGEGRYVFEHASSASQAAYQTEYKITSSSQELNAWLRRSQSDVHMMLLGNPEPDYPYAGVPWFSTVFGRDGIITALQYLWLDPAVACGVLEFLASTQATETSSDHRGATRQNSARNAAGRNGRAGRSAVRPLLRYGGRDSLVHHAGGCLPPAHR